MLERVAEANGLLCLLTDAVDGELLDSAPNLLVVSTMAVGCDHIDLAACRERGIPVGNTPDVLTDATADLTLALLLALARRLPEGIEAVRDGTWSTWEPDWLLGVELRDLTIGIVGPGRIGRAVARRCEAFGMTVIESGRPGGATPGLPLADLLRQADVVSIHCPLTPDTEGMVDGAFLSAMKPTAMLVNTSRGGVVDQRALATALADGTIAGAALDVTTPEPLPADDPLLEAPNLIVIPHLGSATRRTREAMANKAVDNLLAGLAGEPLPDRVA
jgi:lactate dehydrogenase-like 2-hydroxyacid dehydrogenase